MNHKVQHIAVTLQDGSVAIMAFILDPRLPVGAEVMGYDPETGLREATDETIQFEINKSAWTSSPVSWRRMDTADIPTDRYFRDAWKDEDGIKVDMVKAVEIQKEVLRAQRKPLLEALDVEYTKALETGDKTEQKRISDEKQVLRDVTDHPSIESAKTPEELKALSLENLQNG